MTRSFAAKAAEDQDRPADAVDEGGEIIIAGRGRVGGIVGRILESAGYQTRVIDYSARTIDNLKAFGVKTYYGDATRPDMLHAAGVEHAQLLVVAIDGKDKITEMVRYVVKTYLHVHVIARAD